MKKFAAMMILFASLCVGAALFAAVSAPAADRAIEFDREALFNQHGDFRGCPNAGNDCAKVIIVPVPVDSIVAQ